uniref:Conserved uncharacterized protein n=1 Tax=Melanopsichium pennsylvanicum 4 TaxID=1398559 RepID=A0A077R9W2_9BASI|nr:conserved uncharacterized protein [Melanopsichium pennsylvanicum 4]
MTAHEADEITDGRVACQMTYIACEAMSKKQAAFSPRRNLPPGVENVVPFDRNCTFPRIWIRGIKHPYTYPGFDALGIRAKMAATFETVKVSRANEQDNKRAVWNPGAHSESRSRVNERPLQTLPWSFRPDLQLGTTALTMSQ